jgi:hypothetical protein
MELSNHIARRLIAAGAAAALAGAILAGAAFAHGPGSGPSPQTLVTERSAGQNSIGRQPADYRGPLDPGIAREIRNARRQRAAEVVTEHSAGQGAFVEHVVRSSSATPVPPKLAGPAGFDWGDAGIGAAATLGLAFSAIGLTALAVRRRRTTAHASV